MKNFKLFIALTIVSFGAKMSANAQATATSTATAKIVTPISIVKNVNLDFGNVAVTSIGGTVVMSPAGIRSVTGGLTLPVITGTVTAASFAVAGEGSYTYAITLPAAATTITSGVNTMTVNTFTSSPTPTGTLSAGGSQTLTVGATLNVNASQAPGTYISGSGFDVTVNYN